jgi:hypothetical protein
MLTPTVVLDGPPVDGPWTAGAYEAVKRAMEDRDISAIVLSRDEVRHTILAWLTVLEMDAAKQPDRVITRISPATPPSEIQVEALPALFPRRSDR